MALKAGRYVKIQIIKKVKSLAYRAIKELKIDLTEQNKDKKPRIKKSVFMFMHRLCFFSTTFVRAVLKVGSYVKIQNMKKVKSPAYRAKKFKNGFN